MAVALLHSVAPIAMAAVSPSATSATNRVAEMIIGPVAHHLRVASVVVTNTAAGGTAALTASILEAVIDRARPLAVESTIGAQVQPGAGVWTRMTHFLSVDVTLGMFPMCRSFSSMTLTRKHIYGTIASQTDSSLGHSFSTWKRLSVIAVFALQSLGSCLLFPLMLSSGARS